MNRPPSDGPLAPVTKFEQFIIQNKGWLKFASFLFAVVITIVLMPPNGPIPPSPETRRLQAAHQLDIAFFNYAQDHDGKYPTGKSSTEIFQQLLDQNYVSDPTVFYFPMAGKTKPTTNTLKPENVCFDVTNGLQREDSDYLPVIFATGFKIDYVPSGKAHLLAKGDPGGIAVAYKSNAARFCIASPDCIPVLDPAFNPKGRTYQQLTPEGPMP